MMTYEDNMTENELLTFLVYLLCFQTLYKLIIMENNDVLVFKELLKIT